MNHRPKKAVILGSTGSVGTQAADALASVRADVTFICGGRNTKLLAEQARRLSVKKVGVADEASEKDLRLLLAGEDIEIIVGCDAICHEVRNCGSDVIVHAVSGMAGIPYAMAAADSGSRLAIANKESIISLGDIIFERVAASGGELIPVDSEHSAIFQCLCTSDAVSPKGPMRPEMIKRILLTASGGPFFGKKRHELENVTPELALAHPTWKMGPKITVDSATLMNKGFEMIEACRLFGVGIEKIKVLIHRQSIVHSMVEYVDTTVMAQLGTPDMRHCVRYALSYPERFDVSGGGLDFAALGKLTFDEPDRETFTSLDTAVRAFEKGSDAPAALIAADEEAVAAFLGGTIGFCDIADITAEALEAFAPSGVCTEESVFEADRTAREIARGIISRR